MLTYPENASLFFLLCKRAQADLRDCCDRRFSRDGGALNDYQGILCAVFHRGASHLLYSGFHLLRIIFLRMLVCSATSHINFCIWFNLESRLIAVPKPSFESFIKLLLFSRILFSDEILPSWFIAFCAPLY